MTTSPGLVSLFFDWNASQASSAMKYPSSRSAAADRTADERRTRGPPSKRVASEFPPRTLARAQCAVARVNASVIRLGATALPSRPPFGTLPP